MSDKLHSLSFSAESRLQGQAHRQTEKFVGQPPGGSMFIAVGPASMLTPLGVKCVSRLDGTWNS